MKWIIAKNHEIPNTPSPSYLFLTSSWKVYIQNPAVISACADIATKISSRNYIFYFKLM